MITEADAIFAAPQVAEVRQAFDEERALAEIREQIVRRDDAKGEYKDALVVIGRKLIEARQVLPGSKVGNNEKYSPAFLSFIEKAGIAPRTAQNYMGFAKNPERLEAYRAATRERTSFRNRRLKVLIEIRDALQNASKEEVLEAINQELANGNAQRTS